MAPRPERALPWEWIFAICRSSGRSGWLCTNLSDIPPSTFRLLHYILIPKRKASMTHAQNEYVCLLSIHCFSLRDIRPYCDVTTNAIVVTCVHSATQYTVLYTPVAMKTSCLCVFRVHIVACTAVAVQWPRDRINNGVMQPVSRQRIGKHVSAATNTHAIFELLLKTVFSTRSVQRGYKEDNSGDPVSWELSSAAEAEKKWRYSSVGSIVTTWA
jgi:hypothetical protein